MSEPIFNQNDYIKSDSYLTQKQADEYYINASGDSVNTLNVANTLYVHQILFSDNTIQSTASNTGGTDVEEVQALIDTSIEDQVINANNTYTGTNIFNGATTIPALTNTNMTSSGTMTANNLNVNNALTVLNNTSLKSLYLQDIYANTSNPTYSLICQYNNNTLIRNDKALGGITFQTKGADNNYKQITMYDGGLIVPTSLTVANRNILTELDNMNSTVSSYSNQITNLNTKTTSLTYTTSGTTITGVLYVTSDLFSKGRNIITELDNTLATVNTYSTSINALNTKTTAMSYASTGTVGTTITGNLFVSNDVWIKGLSVLSFYNSVTTLLLHLSKSTSGKYTMAAGLVVNGGLTVDGVAITGASSGGLNPNSDIIQEDFIYMANHNGSGTISATTAKHMWTLNASNRASGFTNQSYLVADSSYSGIYSMLLNAVGGVTNNVDKYFNIYSYIPYNYKVIKKVECIFRSTTTQPVIMSFGLSPSPINFTANALVWTKKDILSATGTQNNFYVSVNTTNVFTSTAIRAGTTGPLQDYGGYVSKWMYLAIEQTSIGFLFTIKDKVNNITEQFYCLFPSQSISAPPTPITTIPNMTLDSAFVAGLWNTNIKPFFQVRSINNFSSTASSCDLDYFGIETKYDRF